MPDPVNLEKQYHSIQFGDRNTWTHYHLIPVSRPVVVPPPVKTNFVDVPGADGSLDFTTALDNKIHYGMREGGWEFLVSHEDIPNYNWATLWSALLADLHGKRFVIQLLDEVPEAGGTALYYFGRIYLSDWNSDPSHSKVAIKYALDPYRYPSVEAYSNREGGVL